MALRSSLVRLARSDLLSKPAGAPVFSKDLTEAKARSKQFFRDVSAPTQHRSARPVVETLAHAKTGLGSFSSIRRARGCPPKPYPIPLTRYPFIVSISTQVCRQVPWAMREFFLEEVTTTAKFRSQLANEWRRCVYFYHRVRAIRLNSSVLCTGTKPTTGVSSTSCCSRDRRSS